MLKFPFGGRDCQQSVVSLGIITTRRANEGYTRGDVASDVSLSLTYVSGCDYIENRSLKLSLGFTLAIRRVRY
jgi:hypothetical protein